MRAHHTLFLLLAACASDPPPRTEVAVDAPQPLPAPSAAAAPQETAAAAGTLETSVSDAGLVGLYGTADGLGVDGGLGGFGVGHGRLGTVGQLDRDVIRGVVLAHMSGLELCYEKALAKEPDLGGRVTVRFVIGTAGDVRSAQAGAASTLHDPDVVACVVARVRELHFPAPQGGEVTVSYPFVFAAAGP